LLGVALVFCIAIAAGAQQRDFVNVELIADTRAIEPGETFRLGVLFKMPPHGHIYWRYPGSSGLATGIEWELPTGFEVSELYWPNPKRFEIEVIDDVSYGYEDEVLLFADVTAPADLDTTQPVGISASPYWLVCIESGQCIPESKSLQLHIDLGGVEASADAGIFEGHASRVPNRLDDKMPVLTVAGKPSGHLQFEAKTPWRFVLDKKDTPARFFPNEGDPWDLSRGQSVNEEGIVALEFRCDGEALEGISGVATLPMRNSATGVTKIFYISLGGD